jgi:hypothetical protein
MYPLEQTSMHHCRTVNECQMLTYAAQHSDVGSGVRDHPARDVAALSISCNRTKYEAAMSKETEPSNSEPCAWVSDAMMDTALMVGLKSTLADTDRQRSIELGEKLHRGRASPTDVFPTDFYFVESEEDRPESFPDFLVSNLYLVSDRLRDALKTGNLGSTFFRPVKLYESDKTTRIDAAYSIIAFGETKGTVLPEQSARIRRMPGPRPEFPYGLQFAPQDDDLTLSADSLLGSDLWIEEHIAFAFFLSDRLVQTLKARDLAEQLRLTRCRIAPPDTPDRHLGVRQP